MKKGPNDTRCTVWAIGKFFFKMYNRAIHECTRELTRTRTCEYFNPQTGTRTRANSFPRVGMCTATVFTAYGHHNMATVTVPWPNLSTQSRFGVGTVECRICRRYVAAYGRIRPCSYSKI